VKVRVFHAMSKPLPQDQIPEDLPPQRVRPKRTSWEEALSQFEKTPPPPPVVSNELGQDSNGTANSSTPQ
jgi:hypothetical protein